MDKAEFPEDSDTSDEDFDPGKANEVVSEVDSDGDSEDPLSDKEDLGKRGVKRRKKTKSRKKQKEEESSDLNDSPEKKLTEEDQKKKVDDLWAMFKKDTSFKPKQAATKSDTQETKENTIEKNVEKAKKEPETVKVTQIFEFAGEEVRVEKEVPTKEAKFINNPSGSLMTGKPKRGGGAKSSGLGSVLGQLGKKQKITTLEKSKLDWDKFKKEENLEEELQTFNKGKDGYLERQDFLQRTDLRRFEIERDIRNVERNKRMNMNNVD